MREGKKMTKELKDKRNSKFWSKKYGKRGCRKPRLKDDLIELNSDEFEEDEVE